MLDLYAKTSLRTISVLPDLPVIMTSHRWVLSDQGKQMLLYQLFFSYLIFIDPVHRVERIITFLSPDPDAFVYGLIPIYEPIVFADNEVRIHAPGDELVILRVLILSLSWYQRLNAVRLGGWVASLRVALPIGVASLVALLDAGPALWGLRDEVVIDAWMTW